MEVMSLRRPPGVFIWMTIAEAPVDLAVARAFVMRLDEPGSTGTSKSTTTGPAELGAASTLEDEVKESTETKRTKASGKVNFSPCISVSALQCPPAIKA
jgi:hypothetical protein